jgi:hypothetical protein
MVRVIGFCYFARLSSIVAQGFLIKLIFERKSPVNRKSYLISSLIMILGVRKMTENKLVFLSNIFLKNQKKAGIPYL